MYISKLDIIGFKNIENAQLSFNAKLNCVLGRNGSGKTNLLDAIYYLSMTKSSIGSTDGQCVRGGADFFMLSGSYKLPRKEDVVCSFKNGATKSIKRNSKEYNRISEHIGLIPIIISSPNDTGLITESGDERRRHLNAFLSQVVDGYVELALKYNQLIANRNRILKNPCGFREVLEVLDMQIDQVASMIFDHRREYVEKLSPLVEQLYHKISGGRESVAMSYKSDLFDGNMAQLLVKSKDKDMVMGFTTVGVHRDDIKLTIEGMPIRKFGSQGQQKSMLLALKLAEALLIASEKEVKPILLLDDVFDRLDPERVENLLDLVDEAKFGQIFLTDSDNQKVLHILSRLKRKSDVFEVENGQVTKKDI